MKAKSAPGNLSGICMVVLTSLIGSCTQEKDFYNPDNNPLPNENEYFGFETHKDMNLNVNYDTPANALVEVYAEEQIETVNGTPAVKAGAEALFKIYTDASGKFSGKMDLPTSVKSVYVYTAAWGLPRFIRLKVENGNVNLDLTQTATSKSTKAAVTRSYNFGASIPYPVNPGANLYSLTPWGAYGSLDYYFDNTGDHYITGYLHPTSTIGEETVGEFADRLMSVLVGNRHGNEVDNSAYVRNYGEANLTMAKEGSVSVAFVNRDASYDNVFGYYYYKKGTSNPQPGDLKKFIVFPNVTTAKQIGQMAQYVRVLKLGDKVQLKYFGENGTEGPSDIFPAGTVIGWFVYADGYRTPDKYFGSDADQIKPDAPLITSDRGAQAYPDSRYITVADEKSGKYVIGVEDGGNKSYCDLLFYAEATPEDAVEGGQPVIPDPETPVARPEAVETKTGTLAFEDIWPTGGDYDMNDLIVEYRHEVTFDKDNRVKKIVHQFTPVYKNAGLVNTFAFQIDPSEPLGWVGDLSDGITVEKETNSFLVFQGLDANINKTFTVTRDFMQGSIPPIRKDEMKKYNPYLISGYKGETPRVEVHLPKHKPTDKIDAALVGTGDDAYYVDKDGLYPFAIDLPVTGFSQTDERTAIGVVYPDFSKWVESKGEQATDWYTRKRK
ncbi:MAG: LruC domain-containing protein [Parabacteroides sp.]|nr:LruC domain-containing protein [Parabacteroides sp.]